MRTVGSHLILVCLCIAGGVSLTGEEAGSGDVTLTFSDRCPLSDGAKIARRTGWTMETLKKQSDTEYELAKETYAGYIPARYDGSKPYGLIVWINAGPKGDIPAAWKSVLDEHQLIWIGANNSGNPRSVLVRMGLALDAVDNMKARYKIDEERIYVAGASGGGKVATILGVAWPEAFRGGFYMIGTCHYRELTADDPGRYWPKGFNAPETKLLADSKKRSRHVFLTGEKDINRKPTLGMYAAYKADRFQHLMLLDIPGLGHALPDGEWFEKGVVALDEIPAKVPGAVEK